jgi:cytochrome c biogenesis protein CcdA
MYWNGDASRAAYYSFLKVFLDPQAQIAGLGLGIGLAFLLGFFHVLTMCYLPAALSALPLAQVARDRRDWLRIAAVLTLAMVAVTALWGAVVGAAGGAIGASITPRLMSSILKPTMVVVGGLMLVVALGELGLVRRILPHVHAAAPAATGGGPHRRAAVLGVTLAATFGIICPIPPYLALLLYVAALGSVGYGALALGVYGLGLAAPVALGGLAVLPANRSARVVAWVRARADAVQLVQGAAFAFVGAAVLAYFWVRYTVPAA